MALNNPADKTAELVVLADALKDMQIEAERLLQYRTNVNEFHFVATHDGYVDDYRDYARRQVDAMEGVLNCLTESVTDMRTILNQL